MNEAEPSSESPFDDGYSGSVLENDTPDPNLLLDNGLLSFGLNELEPDANQILDDGLLSFGVNAPQPGSILPVSDFSSPVPSQAEPDLKLLFNDNSWSNHLDNAEPDPGFLFSDDNVNQPLLNKDISDNTDMMISGCLPTSIAPRKIRAREDSCVNLDPKIYIPTAEENMNEQIRRRWCYAAPFGAFNTIAVCKRDTPESVPSESSMDPPEPVASEFLNIPRCWLSKWICFLGGGAFMISLPSKKTC
jgi:hypothetical protein